MLYYGGIEGGATKSTLVICNEEGQCCSTVVGLSTNHWIIGIEECVRRINDMVKKGKIEAGIDENIPLASLGLCLSGCDQPINSYQIEEELLSTYPNITEHCVVKVDAIASILTVSDVGGMVMISGTGSNTLLINPDGTTYSSGGWGHFLGDEGSASHITKRAIKIIFDEMDNFQKSPFPIETVWDLIKAHFNVQNRSDLLPHMYTNFDKAYFASLCKKLSVAAESGDDLAKFLFKEAGEQIARKILSLLPKVHSDLLVNNELHIICVGSVWLSWPLLKDAFLSTLSKARPPLNMAFKLIRLTKCAAFGACYMAAGDKIPRNYFANYEVFYHMQSPKI